MQDLVMAAGWIAVGWGLLKFNFSIRFDALLRRYATGLTEETAVTASVETCSPSPLQ